MKTKHPMQPIIKAEDGVIRFKKNKIVRLLLDMGPVDLNKLAIMDFSNEDRMQFAQLIGYSVSGFGELNYCDKETVNEADRIADIINEKESKEKLYPCAECGTLRTKAEGGTTFTVCDECWDK